MEEQRLRLSENKIQEYLDPKREYKRRIRWAGHTAYREKDMLTKYLVKNFWE
jgi:hypothetical protein